MSVVAVLLTALGVADLCRRAVLATWPPLLIGPVVVLVCAGLSALWHGGDIPLLVLAAAAVVAWEWPRARSELSGRRQGAPLAVFVGALALLIVLSGWSSPANGVAARWSAWVHLPLSHVTPNRLLMLVGVVLVQLATANQLVRLVLGSVGAVRPTGEPQPSDRLKGGRLLGQMERLLILSLGVAGQVAAASAVVAAKGIIRFPELNAQTKGNGGVGIDEVTEYFLVGSFTSWLLAMGGIGLVVATR